MDITVPNPKALVPPATDAAAALGLFAARVYATWVLWSLYVAAHLPFGLHAVELPVVAAALALVATWRGLSWPPAGSALGAVKTAVLYAVLGLAAAWYVGAAPEVPEAFGDVTDLGAAPL